MKLTKFEQSMQIVELEIGETQFTINSLEYEMTQELSFSRREGIRSAISTSKSNLAALKRVLNQLHDLM